MKLNLNRLKKLRPLGVRCEVRKRSGGKVYVVVTIPGHGRWDFVRTVKK